MVPLGVGEWQRALWAEGVAAYIDVLAARLGSDAELQAAGDGVGRLLTERLSHPPASEVWVMLDGVPGSEARAPALAIRALGAGPSAVVVSVAGEAAIREPVTAWTLGTHRLLAEQAPAPILPVTFEDAAGGATSRARSR